MRFQNAYDLAKKGDFENIDKDILVRCYNSLKRIHTDFRVSCDDLAPETKHYWFVGSTGTGKSKTAREKFTGFYLKNASNKWWDGYTNEENVIVDDFDKDFHYMGYYLKIWADIYSFSAEVKNGSTGRIRPKVICVTSNYEPSEIWTESKTLDPLLRRFKIIKFPCVFSIN